MNERALRGLFWFCIGVCSVVLVLTALVIAGAHLRSQHACRPWWAGPGSTAIVWDDGDVCWYSEDGKRIQCMQPLDPTKPFYGLGIDKAIGIPLKPPGYFYGVQRNKHPHDVK